YKNIFTIQDCIQGYFYQPRSVSQIVNLLNRVKPSDDIIELNLSHQNFSENGNGLVILLPLITQHIPHLRTLSLNSSSVTDINVLAQTLPYSELQTLDLSVNQITNITALAQALPHSALQTLILTSNQITDIDALAQALPRSALQTLFLTNNQIND